MSDQKFFRVVPQYVSFKGDKFFKWDVKSGKVTQVCLSGAKSKRGHKHNTVGLHLIDKMTFFSNYLSGDFVEKAAKEDYETKFKEIVNILS